MTNLKNGEDNDKFLDKFFSDVDSDIKCDDSNVICLPTEQYNLNFLDFFI